MKLTKKIISTIMFLTITVNLFVNSQNKTEGGEISQAWKQVEEYADDALPESALAEVEKILTEAEKKQNMPEFIKAFVYKMRFTLEKNPDEAPKLITNFEALIAKQNNPADKALFSSMTAELYSMFYQSNNYAVNQRTDLQGYTPEDINEWTKSNYVDKISTLLAESLASPQILQQTDINNYKILLNQGEDNDELQPTLFDFLANRRIALLQEFSYESDMHSNFSDENLFADADKFIKASFNEFLTNSIYFQIIQTYQQLLDFRLKEKNIPAIISADLARLNHFNESNSDSYIDALKRLEERYKNNEAVVEVLLAKANYYTSQFYSFEYELKDLAADNKQIAYDICMDGIERFPNYKRIGALINLKNQLTQRTLSVNSKDFVRKNGLLKLNIETQNIDELILDVYRLNATAEEFLLYQYNEKRDKRLFPRKTLVESRTIAIKATSPLKTDKTQVEIKSGDYGIYEYTLKAKNDTSKYATAGFAVSDISYFIRQNETDKKSLYTVNGISGKQIPNVLVKSYLLKWTNDGYKIEFSEKATSNKEGLCQLPLSDKYENQIMLFENGEDKYFASASYSHYYQNLPSSTQTEKLTLLTDRSLYRPGQTVHFKGIAYFSDKSKQRVAANSKYEVELRDANNKIVSTKSLTTNEFGSFSASFVLPEGGLNGAYSLRTGNTTQRIWVEEYKRPTFEVKIEKPKTEVAFGQNISVKGEVKAYAGYALPNADVKYRVIRRPHWRWWWSYAPEMDIASGSATSDSNGKFTLTFTAERPNKKGDQFYTYLIYADVTDSKGETQQGEQSLSIGDKSLFIVSEIPDKIEKDKTTSFALYAETLNGEKKAADIIYTLYSLKEKDQYSDATEDVVSQSYSYTGLPIEKDSFEIDKKIISGNYHSKDEKLNLNLKSLKSGRYKIIFTTKDAQGREVKTENIFVAYSLTDKRPPVKSYVWLLNPKQNFIVGETAQIRFGTAAKDVFLLYEIMQGNNIIESRWLKLSNEIRTFNIPFLEKYGAGVTVQFTFVKDEQFFTRSLQLTRKAEEKKLAPKLSVFRDKLKPGETSEWTINIPEAKILKTQAEVMAAMYDASLDAIRPHSWLFNPTFHESIPYSPQWASNAFQKQWDQAYFQIDTEDVEDFSLSSLNWFGLEFGYGRRMYKFGRSNARGMVTLSENDVAIDIADLQEQKVVVEQDIVNLESAAPSIQNSIQFTTPVMVEESGDGGSTNKTKSVQPRTNFNETAFFYPQLRTDEEGNVKLSFTVPESLTRWNVNLLAHTKDLYFGQSQEQVITQKEVMIQLNMPRFVRRSDKAVISAAVTNLTEKEITANVYFELIDPATEKTIALKDKEIRKITLKANENKSVEWEITEFSSYELVICKAIVESEEFSDGEQHYLPVLPDKVLLTESLPLTIRGNQTRTFNFKNLAENASKVETQNLFVEFSSNPAWYAVQALPTLAVPENSNAMDYFAAYYVNTLASYIANSNPKLSTMFDRWKREGGSREALLSNLEKNTELKNMLLEETPWVAAAQDETEQKRQIALLFDLNQQKQQNEQYWEKLISLQKASGAFTWFEGMAESRYITQYVLLNYARLNSMFKNQSAKTEMPNAIQKAIEYVDLQIARDFDQLKKNNKNYKTAATIGNMQYFYLHLRSMYPDVAMSQSTIEAVNYYTEQAYKYWKQATLYGKAATALIASRNDNTKLAASILKSLKENAMKTDEMGMYWSKNTSGYFWNERPIMVHTMLLETFAAMGNNPSDVEELKIWLLKQKQTQRWDSPLSTVDAVYALLNYGSDWLASEGDVKITVGQKELKAESKEAGTGYFKQSIPTTEITPQTASVTVSKQDANIGWGAMYWQYYQDFDKVQQARGALSVSKKLFLEKMQSDKKTIIPIEQAELKTGDKIITRLVVTSDRDLEFVALKDLRASCLEATEQSSGYVWREGTAYYKTTKDASTQFFFSFLAKGTYVFEYEAWVNASGEYASGVTSIQCQYAPEFVSHSAGSKIIVK